MVNCPVFAPAVVPVGGLKLTDNVALLPGLTVPLVGETLNKDEIVFEYVSGISPVF